MKSPRYVHEYTNRHGKKVYYLRRPGCNKQRLDIPEGVLPQSRKFMEIYEAALNNAPMPSIVGAGRTVPGTVNAALVSYYQTAAFKDSLAETTQKSRRAVLEQFRSEHGDKRVAMMPSEALQRIIDRKSPAAARNFKKAMRGFIKHCVSTKLIRVDPLDGIEMAKMKTAGHHPWDTAECEQFEAFYPVGTRARLAYELLLQAGQSRCDVVSMGRQHINNGLMSMRRQKTGVPFNVTITPRLQEAIDAMPPSMTFLITAQGKPFTAAGFGNWFRDVCRAAKLPERCTSHGLRKAAATYLAEHGATDHQLMAWFGWSSISQAQDYTKAASGKRMGRSAGKLISGTGIGSPIDPVSQKEQQPIENIGNGK